MCFYISVGHSTDVVQLSGALHLPGLLVSLDKSGVIRLWDVRNGDCIGKTSSSDAVTSVVYTI
jgi:WD40 repeat protein